jgi:hypothetical protein
MNELFFLFPTPTSLDHTDAGHQRLATGHTDRWTK